MVPHITARTAWQSVPWTMQYIWILRTISRSCWILSWICTSTRQHIIPTCRWGIWYTLPNSWKNMLGMRQSILPHWWKFRCPGSLYFTMAQGSSRKGKSCVCQMLLKKKRRNRSWNWRYSCWTSIWATIKIWWKNAGHWRNTAST